MSRWPLALLLAATFPALAQARDALSAIDQCLAQLDRGLDVGYERIAARCPDLGPSLAASPYAAWLPPGWNKTPNRLSAGALEELRTLLAREANRPSAVSAMRVARVPQVLATLAPPEKPRAGWWSHFKEWLRDVIARRPQPDEEGWLRRLLGDLTVSDTVARAIDWVALAIVIALAGAIVANELRIAGVPGDRRQLHSRHVAADAPPGELTLDDIEQANPSQQPQLLLELVTARLGAQQRLPPARALTVRELTRAARLPDEADRARLAELAVTCEQARFAEREIAPQRLASALRQGRELLASLEARPLTAPGTA